MALGSKNRDYKTSGRSIEANLRRLDELTEKYIKEGMSKEAAGNRAFKDITGYACRG